MMRANGQKTKGETLKKKIIVDTLTDVHNPQTLCPPPPIPNPVCVHGLIKEHIKEKLSNKSPCQCSSDKLTVPNTTIIPTL